MPTRRHPASSCHRSRRAITALVLPLAVALAISGCLGTTGGQDTPTTHDVRYAVTLSAGEGPAAADMTFQDESGIAQQLGERLPWNYTRMAADGDALYVSAQNKGDGTITCTITVDGQDVKTTSSSGEFAICQADVAL